MIISTMPTVFYKPELSNGGMPPPEPPFLLLQTGFNLLLQGGGRIIINEGT